MMQVVFGCLRAKSVDDLLIANSPQCRYREHLRLTSCEKA